MFLNETRHGFSELFHFSVICSPCSRKSEEKVNINSERVNTKVQLIYSCSESCERCGMDQSKVPIKVPIERMLLLKFFVSEEAFKSS